jgi:chemotaxis protein CheC
VSVGALERSALNEMGNIVCAAYVGVLGSFLGKGVMIGTPLLQEIERTDLDQDKDHEGLVIETDFTFLDTTFEGVFVLSHSDVSFNSLLRALGFKDV